MPLTVARSAGEPWLDARATARLERRVREGLRRARAGGRPTLVSVSAALPGEHDPTAVVCASRRSDEPWFCFEQPDRDRAVLAALGRVRALEAGGPDRFARLAANWRDLAAGALADDPAGPAGSGLVAVGGLAFAAGGGTSPWWRGFAPASFVVPEVSLARRTGNTWLTVNLEVAPDDTGDDALARV